MSILTHHVSFDQFVIEDEYPIAPACTSIDHAWQTGFDAALEANGFEDVFPSADFTPAEAQAFRLGSVEGFRAKEFEIEDARDSSLDDWQVEELYEEWCYRNGLDYDRADYGHNANEWETV